MNDIMKISFPGGLRVNTEYHGFTVQTDQDGAAPTPFDLFLSSLGACAGIYVLQFLRSRNIPAENAEITMTVERDPAAKRLSKVGMRIHLPAEFPEKYRAAVINAASLCAVKKAIMDPPEFEITAVAGG